MTPANHRGLGAKNDAKQLIIQGFIAFETVQF